MTDAIRQLRELHRQLYDVPANQSVYRTDEEADSAAETLAAALPHLLEIAQVVTEIDAHGTMALPNEWARLRDALERLELVEG